MKGEIEIARALAMALCLCATASLVRAQGMSCSSAGSWPTERWPMTEAPGTRFDYNGGASQLLAHVFAAPDRREQP